MADNGIEEKVPADQTLALTFTNHAADEMRDRLKKLLPAETALPRMGTFHAICRSLLVEGGDSPPVIATQSERLAAARDALRMIGQEGKNNAFSAAGLLRDIDQAKQALAGPGDDLQGVFPGRPREQLEELGRLYRWYRNVLSVQQRGEFEDLIGTMEDHLERRSAETILQAARQVLSPSAQGPGCGFFSGIQGHPYITLLERESELGEAGAVAKTIGRLIGGTGYHSRDTAGIDPGDDVQWGFADFAVLFRTREQANPLRQEFTRAGVPWQMVSRHPPDKSSNGGVKRANCRSASV